MDPRRGLWTPLELVRASEKYLAERGVASPRLDAELLLADVLAIDRMQLYLQADRPIVADELARYRNCIRQRGRRVPLQILLGRAHLLEGSFEVTAGVFVPRPETETLVLVARDLPFGDEGPGHIVEVGTGTGCVGILLLRHWPRARLTGFDLDVAAVALTRRNASRHGVADRLVAVKRDPLAEGLPPCDLLVSNPPYVRSGDIAGLEPEVRDHDPRIALDGGADGLDVIRRLAERGVEAVRPGGWLALEHGCDQAEACSAALAAAGWQDVELHRDLAERPRVATARRPSAGS